MGRDTMDDQKFADKKRARSSFNGSTTSKIFNAAEANRVLSDRWKQVNARASDPKISIEDRPQIYKAPPSTGSAWGKRSLHLQEPIDFLGELRAAIARNGS